MANNQGGEKWSLLNPRTSKSSATTLPGELLDSWGETILDGKGRVELRCFFSSPKKKTVEPPKKILEIVCWRFGGEFPEIFSASIFNSSGEIGKYQSKIPF